MKITGAIFDMDGLLFDTEQVFNKAWYITAQKNGFQIQQKMLDELRGTSGKVMDSIILKYVSDIDVELIHKQLFENAYCLLQQEVPIKPGVLEILDYFKNHHIKIALASSSPQTIIENNLKVAGIQNYFDVIVNGQEVQYGKPSPDIFLLAVKRLDCLPEECYVFEDALPGVAAGVAAGCKTIMIPDLVKPTQLEYQTTFGIYKDLHEALNAIAGE